MRHEWAWHALTNPDHICRPCADTVSAILHTQGLDLQNKQVSRFFAVTAGTGESDSRPDPQDFSGLLFSP